MSKREEMGEGEMGLALCYIDTLGMRIVVKEWPTYTDLLVCSLFV
jgi:hypothetical protein